jgi:hypothetical protein
MKVYVVGYKTRPENEPPVDPSKSRQNIDVGFSQKRGDWLFNDRGWAQQHLDSLASKRVHVGEHYCRLEIEEEDGTFAIVCMEHPEEARG